MLLHYQVGDGPLLVIHIVVGTPWFITQTDSVGCLLRFCRWVSINILKKEQQKKYEKIYYTNYDGGFDGDDRYL